MKVCGVSGGLGEGRRCVQDMWEMWGDVGRCGEMWGDGRT